jgi:zinc transporter 1/2/3
VTLIWLKVGFAVVIFGVGMAGGLVALRLARAQAAEQALARGNAFAAGVFLGAGLIHMLGDAQAKFAAAWPDAAFPYPEFIAGLAALLILATDQLGSSLHRPERAEGRPLSGHGLLLLLVLSVHSIIAGGSLGLEDTLLATLVIFLAIIAHKGAASFALGTALVGNGAVSARHANTITLFSLMTPIGIALGTVLAVALASDAAVAFEAVFDALAAGTFLYVATVDIVHEAFGKAADRRLKLSLAGAGFAVMAVLAIWA